MDRIRLILLGLLLGSAGSVMAASWDVGMDQRNPTDTGWVVRLLNSPSTDGLMQYDPVTRLPKWVTLGSGLSINSGVLQLPTFAPVATSGAYADLTGKPTIPAAQVQSDWNATSGVTAIANKPALATVATSGAYADLSGRPTIPASQVPADWNASSGPSQVLNKPAIPAAQVQTDWNAVSGLSSIANRPNLAAVATSGAYGDLSGRPSLAAVATSGAYADLTGRPTIPAAQVQTDWNAVSGLGVLLNKPATFTPAAHTHAAADIVSGTLADARIPTLAISKTTGLQTALDAKFNAPGGTTSQYVRGDGSLATLPVQTAFTMGAPVSRTVAVGTAYQCTDTTKACVLTITLSAQSSISLSGTSNNEAVITAGSTSAVASGTGTNVATYRNLLGGGLVVGLSITSAQANTYTVALPAGWYFAVRQTTGTGLTVVAAFDQTAG